MDEERDTNDDARKRRELRRLNESRRHEKGDGTLVTDAQLRDKVNVENAELILAGQVFGP